MTPEHPKICVVREWMFESCTMKMQAVLLSSLRGCDGFPKEDVSKRITRGFRGVLFHPADDLRTTSFMIEQVDSDVVREMASNIDKYPVHFITHLMHAMEIVGYKHPERNVRECWGVNYRILCSALHLNPETERQLDTRLSDFPETTGFVKIKRKDFYK